jgi:hypothetical protein
LQLRQFHSRRFFKEPFDVHQRSLRNRRFWGEEQAIRPGKIVGWILEVEDGGWRIKR